MIKLRTALLCRKLYILIFIVVLIITIIRILIPNDIKYNENITETTAIITNIYIDGSKLHLDLLGKEKLIANYYFKTKKEKIKFKNNFSIGDKIKLTGTFSEIEKPGTKNIFNYKKYLQNQKIYFQVSINDIKLISKTKNIYYKLKQKIIKHLNNNAYLYTFILGNKDYVKKDILSSYQNNGISHLFAISGMHINLLGSIILKLLKKIRLSENKSYIVASTFLIFYLFLTGLTASTLRGVLFFVLFSINKIYYLYIKNVYIFIITLATSLLINPFYIYDVGFWYSFTISLSLIVMSEYINSKKNYFNKLLATSLISFIISIPISLYNFYQLNVISIFYNLFFVPLISIIIFPLSLIVYILPILMPIYNILITVLEKTSLSLSNVKIFTFIFPKLNLIFYLLYFIFTAIFLYGLKKSKKLYFVPLSLLLIIHYLNPYFNNSNYVKMIDVGQGDSFLLHSNNKNVLIDTGGKINYKSQTWEKTSYETSIVKNTTIPLLKSLGIKKIDYLFLTHGDYDHLGEAITLIDNFPVTKVYINEGNINNYEKQIIKKSNQIFKAKKNMFLKVGKFYIYQLNSDLKEENDSSSVYYILYDNIKMIFMADASIKSEKAILNDYNLGKIDIIKIGHHGSITSSSNAFLKKINPSIALISAGKNNKFNHPRKEILKRLNDLSIKYYLTINDGTTTIDLDKYMITTDK